MWRRDEIKMRAKDKLKIYYWPAFVVSMVLYMFTGASFGYSGFLPGGDNSTESVSVSPEEADYSTVLAGGDNSTGGVDVSSEEVVYITIKAEDDSSIEVVDFSTEEAVYAMIFLVVILTVILIVLVPLILFKIFVGNVLEVGGRRFYMESREAGRSVGVGRLGWGFGCGHYLNIVKIMFLRDLHNILWYCLLFVPGIYKNYEYCMIPYILSERPDMDKKQVFALTKEMMDGSRLDKFVLEMTFFGWYLLGLMACLVGIFFVNPYYDATEAELYGCFREYYLQEGLTGYGHQKKESEWEWKW